MNNINFWRISTFICIVIILFLTDCNRQKEFIEVPINMEVPVPGIAAETDTIYKPRPIRIEVPEPGMNELLDKYAATMDSLERLKLYVDAITIRDYNNTFDDDTITIHTYSKVRGDLLEQSNKYFVKPRTISLDTTIEVKKPRFNSFYLLGGVSSHYPIKTPVASLKAMFLNKNDRVFGLEAGTDASFGIFYGVKF